LLNSIRAFSAGGRQPFEAGELPPVYDKNRAMSVLEVGAGRMYVEEKAETLSMRGFDQEPVCGPFGTFDDPVPILSNFNNRVVACLGGGELQHDILWMQLDGSRKHMCDECGQFFKLYTINSLADVDKLTDKEKASIWLRYKDHLALPSDFDAHKEDGLLMALEVEMDTIPDWDEAAKKLASQEAEDAAKRNQVE